MLLQPTKLQANGIDLGGDMLFGTRLGFSGTPSDLLPSTLQPCHYEPGSEAQVVRVLTSDAHVTHVSPTGEWSADVLLRDVANAPASCRYHALIDTGALVTGLTNEGVARRLLALGLAHVDVCIFLNAADEKMVVARGEGPATPLSRCGVPLARRFCFYDQVRHLALCTMFVTLRCG